MIHQDWLVEDLVAVADLVEKGWTQGVPATDSKGARVEFSSPKATHFCLIGAMARAIADLPEALEEVRRRRADALHEAILVWLPHRGMTIPAWNDAFDRTQEEVVGLVRRIAEEVNSIVNQDQLLVDLHRLFTMMDDKGPWGLAMKEFSEGIVARFGSTRGYAIIKALRRTWTGPWPTRQEIQDLVNGTINRIKGDLKRSEDA